MSLRIAIVILMLYFELAFCGNYRKLSGKKIEHCIEKYLPDSSSTDIDSLPTIPEEDVPDLMDDIDRQTESDYHSTILSLKYPDDNPIFSGKQKVFCGTASGWLSYSADFIQSKVMEYEPFTQLDDFHGSEKFVFIGYRGVSLKDTQILNQPQSTIDMRSNYFYDRGFYLNPELLSALTFAPIWRDTNPRDFLMCLNFVPLELMNSLPICQKSKEGKVWKRPPHTASAKYGLVDAQGRPNTVNYPQEIFPFVRMFCFRNNAVNIDNVPTDFTFQYVTIADGNLELH